MSVGLLTAYEGKHPSLAYSGSKEFERLKALVGVWEGTAKMPREGEKVRVEYRLSSGGSAVTISFIDKDHIIQKWTLFTDGKETETKERVFGDSFHY